MYLAKNEGVNRNNQNIYVEGTFMLSILVLKILFFYFIIIFINLTMFLIKIYYMLS